MVVGQFVQLSKLAVGFGLKPKMQGTVSGAPLKTAEEVNGKKWWSGAYEVVVTVSGVFDDTRQGSGLGSKNQNCAWFRVHHWKQLWRAIGGGSGVVCKRWWSWKIVHSTMQGRGAGWGQKNQKPSCRGSVLVLPFQTAVEECDGRWQGSSYDTAAVTGWGVHKCEVGEGWGPKT